MNYFVFRHCSYHKLGVNLPRRFFATLWMTRLRSRWRYSFLVVISYKRSAWRNPLRRSSGFAMKSVLDGWNPLRGWNLPQEDEIKSAKANFVVVIKEYRHLERSPVIQSVAKNLLERSFFSRHFDQVKRVEKSPKAKQWLRNEIRPWRVKSTAWMKSSTGRWNKIR